MILASQSPRRIQLMREAGFDPRVIPARIDEAPLPGEGAGELVERLAREKAHAVAREHAQTGEAVLAADTVVCVDERVLGKPQDPEDARRMLRSLSGRAHQVKTGVCLGVAADAGTLDPALTRTFVASTNVEFFELDDEEISSYVQSGEPMDKAGAYGIQGQGGRLLVKGIDGDFYNVMGLPIARIVRALRTLPHTC